LKSAIKRIVTLLKRKQRARRLGFRFKRAAAFTPPSEIQIGTKRLSLSLTDDGGTRTAFIDVLLDDCYRLHELPDDIHKVVDIGCHIGLFSIAARNRWPQAVIHAYEPNAALKSNWEHHAIQAGFSVYGEAVGITSGSVALAHNADSVQVRTVETGNGTIHQIPFRDALARLGGNADLVKLDCEGAEWPILQDEEPWKQVRFLTMEFHLWAGYTLEELKACLSKIGFQIRRLEVTGPDFGVLLAGR
jgi:FkbM family methyltransferase